jgi:hypothetical protein
MFHWVIGETIRRQSRFRIVSRSNSKSMNGRAFPQIHPCKVDAELTLKERALFGPLLPNANFLLYPQKSTLPDHVQQQAKEIGDLTLTDFAIYYTPTEVLGFRDVGPKTVKILKAVLKAAKIEWKDPEKGIK